ncbi:hypothetical protein GQ600_20519 [Phytophthora cactorum]|nr:hypothetical protein GQ600_20519 [Phytophthora cactorum]
MAPKPALPPCGYMLLDEAEARDYDPVFKEVGGLHDDPDREQSRVQGASTAVGKLRRAIRAVTACLDPGWNPTVFSFMRLSPEVTNKSRTRLPRECDCSTSKKTPGRVPASVVFALEKGTSLRGYAGYFMTRDDIKARLLESNAMRTHRRYCDKNHEAAKNQKTRRSTDNKKRKTN